MDERGIPFLLDDEGHVWGFRKPFSLEDPIKLPKLENIAKIAPYVAVDTEGQVFTWSIDEDEMKMEYENLTEAAYTSPHKFSDLTGVTSVASSEYHFVAVINNRDIVEWSAIPTQMGFGIKGYTPIRKVISRNGVKAISTDSSLIIFSAATTSTERVDTIASGVVALFDDGTVMGWRISSSGQTLIPSNISEAEAINSGMRQGGFEAQKNTFLTKHLDAADVAMDARHIVILRSNAVPLYWGSCEARKVNRGEHPFKGGELNGAEGFVHDALSVTLRKRTNVPFDIFLKKDGTIWTAYALGAPDMPPICLGTRIMKLQEWQIRLGSAPAVQVAVGGQTALILDADHKLWRSDLNRFEWDAEHKSQIRTPFHNSFAEVAVTLK
jgi:alpha-tubulin suppressor-like RCC1 family protein